MKQSTDLLHADETDTNIQKWVRTFQFLVFILANLSGQNQIDFLQELYQNDFMKLFPTCRHLLDMAEGSKRYINTDLSLQDLYI